MYFPQASPSVVIMVDKHYYDIWSLIVFHYGEVTLGGHAVQVQHGVAHTTQGGVVFIIVQSFFLASR